MVVQGNLGGDGAYVLVLFVVLWSFREFSVVCGVVLAVVCML